MQASTETQASLVVQDDKRAYLRRVQVTNFRSLGSCCVDLGALTVLVGRNGAGKSNFLDALRFVADGLQTSLDHAIQSRGGIDAVRRKSTGHPRNFAISLTWLLPDRHKAMYSFEIAGREKGGFVVKDETLRIHNSDGKRTGYYSVREGTLRDASPQQMPLPSHDRLFLVAASGIPLFRPAYDALVAMGFYNLNPDRMKELQSPDAGELLRRDGSNIASVIARLSADKPEVLVRIKQFLERIVPGIRDFARHQLGPRETLQFRQGVKGSKHPWKFYAMNMSDGTLRSLGALTAVMQLANRAQPVTLVGIEEPETALHPAATSILMDALRAATSRTQVLLTTHSPDLLDQIDPQTDSLLVVVAPEGRTEIAAPDKASLEAVKQHLYTPGELLRLDQLDIDPTDIGGQKQMSLPFCGQEDDDS